MYKKAFARKLKDNKYLISEDQIFLYNSSDWKAMPGYSFVKPLKSIDKFNIENERPLSGVVKYTDGTFNKEELIGFRPGSEYEFIINGERLYRVIKNAAATKKLAIFDAFEILTRIQEEESLLEGKPLEEKKEVTFKGFAEGRSK